MGTVCALGVLLSLLVSCRTETLQVPSSNASGATDARALVRTYVDGQGQTIRLLQGRGEGGGGDWGWLHIKGKHVDGQWSGGGPVTTFPAALGATSDEAVQDLIGQALQQSPELERGRSLYHYAVPGTPYEVLVVVGNDGTIITAYPERPRRSHAFRHRHARGDSSWYPPRPSSV